MKKFLAVIAAALIFCAALAGCASETAEQNSENAKQTQNTESAENEEQTTPEEEVNNAQNPYYFEADGVKIAIMDEADAVMEQLGDPASEFEADSCAFQGKDMFYYYGGFQLTVNDVDGVNRITAVTLVDDTVKTPEGLGIGSAEEDITAAFGNDFTQTAGLYVYRYGDMSLQIKAENGKVTSIVYAYSEEQ